MTSFGWKRKLGQNVSKEKIEKFSSNSKADGEDDEDVDWLSLMPTANKKIFLIEDAKSKSERLKKEGIILAEAERFWEAIKKWNEALQLTPANETVMEMKAQALLSVSEVLPALQAAQKTVELAPSWWVAHQTLGRALVNIGEVKMALKSFSRALHINPIEKELWEEDLLWTQSILAGKETSTCADLTVKQKALAKKKKKVLESNAGKEGNSTHQICEAPDSSNEQSVSCIGANESISESESSDEDDDDLEESFVQIPDNYVHMRDPT